MKSLFLGALVLAFASSSALADAPKLGDPASYLQLAENAVAPYLKADRLLTIHSIPRSEVTPSDGPCNPFAWQFLLAPEAIGAGVTATVTVFEEAYAVFDDNDKMTTQCVLSTHFTVSDTGYPYDTAVISPTLLSSAMSLDDAASLAQKNGLPNITGVVIRQWMTSPAPHSSAVFYDFAGTDASGKASSVVVDATNKKIGDEFGL